MYYEDDLIDATQCTPKLVPYITVHTFFLKCPKSNLDYR
jgi:hypothetical protein